MITESAKIVKQPPQSHVKTCSLPNLIPSPWLSIQNKYFGRNLLSEFKNVKVCSLFRIHPLCLCVSLSKATALHWIPYLFALGVLLDTCFEWHTSCFQYFAPYSVSGLEFCVSVLGSPSLHIALCPFSLFQVNLTLAGWNQLAVETLWTCTKYGVVFNTQRGGCCRCLCPNP